MRKANTLAEWLEDETLTPTDRVKRCTVWQAAIQHHGCLPDSSELFATKTAAIEYALDYFFEYAPRGTKTKLSRGMPATASHETAEYVTVTRLTVGDTI